MNVQGALLNFLFKEKSMNKNKLLRRINRRLHGVIVRVCRYDSRWFHELGRYYLVSDDNVIVEKDVDLEDLAASLRVS